MVDDKLVRMLALCLDGPLRPERWEELLDQLVEYAGGISAALSVADPEHDRRESPFQSRFIREEGRPMLESFLAHGDVDDTPGIRRLQKLPKHRLYHEIDLFDVASIQDLPRSRFRDFQRERFGIQHRYGMQLNNLIGFSDLLHFHAAEDLRVTSPPRVEGMELLAPVVGKALRLYRIFQALKARFNAMLAVLDRLTLGAVVLLEDGTIVEANTIALDILAQRDGLLRNAAGHLEASDPDFAPNLKQAIAEVRHTALLVGWTPDRSFPVRRPSRKPDYLVSMGPLVDSLGELEKNLACVIAFIADPAEVTPISTEGLAEVGHLTPAEAAVCHLLVNGCSLVEIARLRGVTRETVKSQASDVMGKLQCRSRLDLVRLAAMIRLPVEKRL